MNPAYVSQLKLQMLCYTKTATLNVVLYEKNNLQSSNSERRSDFRFEAWKPVFEKISMGVHKIDLYSRDRWRGR
jgi:hypothetical protein